MSQEVSRKPAHENPDMDRDTVTAKALLRSRAQLLAKPLAEDGGNEDADLLTVLEFSLGGERYALDIAFVHEVHRLKNLTPVPCTPPFVLGIVNVRGHLYTVINLKKFFHLPEQGLTDLHRIVLVGKTDIEFGLLADADVSMLQIRRQDLQASLPTLSGIGAHYLQGIAPDGLILLNMNAILADPALLVDEDPDGSDQTANARRAG